MCDNLFTGNVGWATSQNVLLRHKVIRPSLAAVNFTTLPHRPSTTSHILDRQRISHVQMLCPYIPRDFSLGSSPDKKPDEKSVGIFQRFKNAYKNAYKEYGKVMFGVHLATSAVWYGMFYYAALKYVNHFPLSPFDT
jgi:hypothetical protein